MGETHFDQREREAVERRLVKRLERMGYTVGLQLSEEAAAELARRTAEFHLAKKRLPLDWRPGSGSARASPEHHDTHA